MTADICRVSTEAVACSSRSAVQRHNSGCRYRCHGCFGCGIQGHMRQHLQASSCHSQSSRNTCQDTWCWGQLGLPVHVAYLRQLCACGALAQLVQHVQLKVDWHESQLAEPQKLAESWRQSAKSLTSCASGLHSCRLRRSTGRQSRTARSRTRRRAQLCRR